MESSNHVQGQIGYAPTERSLASTTVSYNIKTRELINQQFEPKLHVGLVVSGQQYQQYALGLRTESRFSFSFTLKGIGSFGT